MILSNGRFIAIATLSITARRRFLSHYSEDACAFQTLDVFVDVAHLELSGMGKNASPILLAPLVVVEPGPAHIIDGS